MLYNAIIVTVIFYAVLAGTLFGSAGTLGLPMFWAYISEMTAFSLLTLILVHRRSPDLIRERMRPGEGEQDKVTLRSGMLLFALHFVIAGLDVGRFHWSNSVPLPLQAIGCYP